jgi:O-antigen ligase
MGDAYSNMGIPSLVLIMALDGFLLCSLYKMVKRGTSANVLLLFTLITAYLPLLFRDGGWCASGYFVITSMSAAWLLIKFGGIRLIRHQNVSDSVPDAEPRVSIA